MTDAANMAHEAKLIQLQISTSTKVWERCLVQTYVPQQADLEYYYRILLGFQDADVKMTVESIPVDFNIALLPSHESAPSDFPANDLETRPTEEEQRAKYRLFITQLCEMERSRAALKTFYQATARAAEAARPKFTHELTDAPVYLVGFAGKQGMGGRREWVSEVLRDLDAEDAVDFDGALVATDEDAPPYGWVISPTVAGARMTMGSRIILNPTIGRKWERLLGTDTYPDLLVIRRLNTKGWSFEDHASDVFLGQLMTWFLASQTLVAADGLTPFCIGLEKELSRILHTLRTIKVGEKLLDMNDDSNPRVRVHKLINLCESQCLESIEINSEIQQVSESVFHRYLSYAFKVAKIPRDVYAVDEKIPVILERWVQAQYGFKEGADPIIPEWKELWHLTMRGKPTAIRVNHFLASMDSWDPIACSTITSTDRSAIAQEWMKIYMDTQIIRCEKNKVKSVVLYDQLRRWCMRFIPETFFGSCFAPSIIGPVLTKRGLISIKEKNGRYISGIKFRSLIGTVEEVGGETPATEEEILASEKLKEVNSVQYTSVTKDNTDGSRTKSRTVEATHVAEKDGARIEHFFAATVTTETIHLGSL